MAEGDPGGRRPIEAGTFWRRVRERSAAALRAGALLPIDTRHEVVEDGGVRFVVHVVRALAEKDRQRRALLAGSKEGLPENPFLPYDEALYVGHLPPAHVALLNKFNVLEDHALVVTEAFEHQETLPTAGDLEALWRCLAEDEPALAFYNGGEVAGASQPHKHLQIVPMPLVPEAPELPIEPLLGEAPRRPGAIVTAPRLPFVHRLAWLDAGLAADPVAAAAETLALCRQALAELGVAEPSPPPGARQLGPYNLLLTRDWLLALPRRVERFEGISANAIAFVGGLLVRSEAELEAVRRAGPMAILRETGVAA